MPRGRGKGQRGAKANVASRQQSGKATKRRVTRSSPPDATKLPSSNNPPSDGSMAPESRRPKRARITKYSPAIAVEEVSSIVPADGQPRPGTRDGMTDSVNVNASAQPEAADQGQFDSADGIVKAVICGDGINIDVQGPLPQDEEASDDEYGEHPPQGGGGCALSNERDLPSDYQGMVPGSTDSEIAFGGTALTDTLMRDPNFRKMIDGLVEDGVQARLQNSKDVATGATGATPQRTGRSTQGRLVKSPSDTTLYRPALRQNIAASINEAASNQDVINKIADFVNTIRLESDRAGSDYQIPRGVVDEAGQAGSKDADQQPVREQEPPGFAEADQRADQLIVDAERFKAALAPPSGECNAPLGKGVSDDDFFHLSCHIDEVLKRKIEAGDFVELERLLPKDKGSNFGANEAGRMEWVHHDGQTFLAPASDPNSKINGIRKWDQAFRVYATIYSGANPSRSQEIWQYITVIHTAAAAYIWDNVSNYDFTFRHLMAFNPQRNWGKIYTQMWNLSMREPLVRNNNFRVASGPGGPSMSSPKGQVAGNSSKPQYCWSFNKGMKCRFGSKCKFVERCSYCDKASHGVHVCPKIFGKTDSAVASTSKSDNK